MNPLSDSHERPKSAIPVIEGDPHSRPHNSDPPPEEGELAEKTVRDLAFEGSRRIFGFLSPNKRFDQLDTSFQSEMMFYF